MKKVVYPKQYIKATNDGIDMYTGFFIKRYRNEAFFMVSDKGYKSDEFVFTFLDAIFQVLYGKTFEEQMPKRSRKKEFEALRWLMRLSSCEFSRDHRLVTIDHPDGLSIYSYNRPNPGIYIFTQNGELMK